MQSNVPSGQAFPGLFGFLRHAGSYDFLFQEILYLSDFVIDLSPDHVVRDEFLLAVAGQCAFRDAEDAAEVVVRVKQCFPTPPPSD